MEKTEIKNYNLFNTIPVNTNFNKSNKKTENFNIQSSKDSSSFLKDIELEREVYIEKLLVNSLKENSIKINSDKNNIYNINKVLDKINDSSIKEAIVITSVAIAMQLDLNNINFKPSTDGHVYYIGDYENIQIFVNPWLSYSDLEILAYENNVKYTTFSRTVASGEDLINEDSKLTHIYNEKYLLDLNDSMSRIFVFEE